MLVSLGKKRQENGTESEKLRPEQNNTDSSAVLFLVPKGPLGVFGNAYLFRFVPICSDFVRFVFRINQHKSGNPLLQVPELALQELGTVTVIGHAVHEFSGDSTHAVTVRLIHSGHGQSCNCNP